MGVPKMLRINFKNLKKITSILMGSLFLLSISPLFSFASNSENPTTKERICLFRKDHVQKVIKKAINLEGYSTITQVETKDGVIRIVADLQK